jgi:hypothetical protein
MYRRYDRVRKYDRGEALTTEVLYDEARGGYICFYCGEDFTHSQLHGLYGGGFLPDRLLWRTRQLSTLRSESCLICELSCGRFAD